MSDAMEGFALDSHWVRRSFDRAAEGYDAAAVLHAEVRRNLLERLQLMAVTPSVVLDAGAGTGHASRALKARYPKALVIALDASAQMLRIAGRRQTWLRRFARVRADAQNLPLANASVDLIVSNLMLHWCDPDATLAEFHRVLKPQGLMCFSTFGPDTLRELRSAWAQVDAAPHVHTFLDMHDVGDAVVRAGFISPVLDVERFTLSYSDLNKVAADLRDTGGRNADVTRRKGLSSPRKFAAMQIAYEKFRQDGRLPATCEVVFAHAWAPAARRPGRPQDAAVPLDEMKRQLKLRRTR
jgi:malonyl-CoA O-methyltransferase